MQLRGPHRLLTLACVCLCVCEVHVHVVCEVCVAGAVVAVPEPGGAVKERGNELCFISFFLWRERAKKDSSSGSEIGGGGCMYVWEGSQQLSPVFLIVSSCGFWTYSRYFNDLFSLYVLKNQLKKIYNGLCCALEMEFTKSWANIWNINSIRYSEGDECFMCTQFILLHVLCFFYNITFQI